MTPVAWAAPTASGDVVVTATDFADGTWDPWTRSGDPSLSVVEVDGDSALLVTGRANDFDGIQSPGGLLRPGGEYEFTAQARLAAGTVGSAGIRFVVKPAYAWVGDTTMTADAWTTVRGTFVVPADAAPDALQVFIGTANLDGPYAYLLDRVTISRTGADAGGESTIARGTDFEDGVGGWGARADAQGPPVVEISTALAHGGAQAAIVRERTTQGDGIGYDVTGLLDPGTTYQISAWLRFAAGAPDGDVWLSLESVDARRV